MPTLVGGSGEPNNEQDDAVTGGNDQLKLNEETRAFLLRPLNSLRSATADLSGEDTAEGSDLLPQGWKPPVAGLCVAQSFGTCVCVYTHSHRCPRAAPPRGSTQPHGRGSAGPDDIFQNPWCVYAYRILERGLRPVELSLSLPLYRWGH